MSSEKHLRESSPLLAAVTNAQERDILASGTSPSSTLVGSYVWEVVAPPPLSSLKVNTNVFVCFGDNFVVMKSCLVLMQQRSFVLVCCSYMI